MNKPTVIDLPSYGDDRGALTPVWNYMDYKEEPDPYAGNAGMNLTNVQRAYFINNSQKGVVRGFHYHEKETKYFVVLRGMAKFVCAALTKKEADAVHERRLGKMLMDPVPQTFVLSERHPQMLIVPPEYANGWMSLTDDCLLLALSSSTFEQSKGDDVRIDPYIFGDVWSVKAR